MLKSIFLRICIIALGLGGCLISALRLYSINNFAKLSPEQNSSLTLKSKSEASEKKENADVRLVSIQIDPFSTFQERSKVAAQYAEFAEKVQNQDEKIKFLCETQAALSSALEKEPLRARSLVTWANVKQLLGSVKCPADRSEGYEPALLLASSSDPLDQQAMFNSGLVFLWAGENEKAFKAFNRVLELGTDTSALQREFIYSLVKDPKTLNSLIPARFPQAIEFIRYNLNPQRTLLINESLPQKAISEFAAVALKEFANRFEFGSIEGQLYLERLYEIWRLSKETQITPLIDGLFAKYYSEHAVQDLASFFSLRSKFSELEIVPGYKSADSRPEKSSLAYWQNSVELPFDEFFTSVGFYLPRENTLRRIELHSKDRIDRPFAGLLRILQSDDNYLWEDVTGLCTVSQVILPGSSVVAIELPGATKRYWKLHFASAERLHEFKGALTDMIRAFGVGSLKG